jgi:hypothetical protein
LLGGEDAIHDWWYLLINWDLLKQDLAIANAVRFAAGALFVASIAVGAINLRERSYAGR